MAWYVCTESYGYMHIPHHRRDQNIRVLSIFGRQMELYICTGCAGCAGCAEVLECLLTRCLNLYKRKVPHVKIGRLRYKMGPPFPPPSGTSFQKRPVARYQSTTQHVYTMKHLLASGLKRNLQLRVSVEFPPSVPSPSRPGDPESHSARLQRRTPGT